jgi:hypothetical protein
MFDLSPYSTYGAAAVAGSKSQNGWPASPSGSAIDIVTVSLPLRLGTKRMQVARAASAALSEMVRWWDSNVEPVETLGSYNYREIRGYEGTGVVSNHGSGTAIDINAAKHPLGAAGTVSASQKAAITAKAATLGLRWGGDYRNRKDEMHFEVALPPTADTLRKLGTVAVQTGAKVWFWTGIAGIGLLLVLKARERAKARGGGVGSPG